VANELNLQLNGTYFSGHENSIVAEQCDLIFLVIPFEHLKETLTELTSKFKIDTILVDVTVPLVFNQGYAMCKRNSSYESASEYIQSLVSKDVTVIGAFKTISASKLSSITKPLNVDVFLTGNNKDKKNELKEILSKIVGLTILDAGPLEFSRTTEQMTAFVINLNKLNKLKHASFKVISDDH
ncbi:MAG: hypothetical protein ACFFDW_12485, partial [Candidatus Thorarchaeota archaeon]